ncbi:MAG: serine/threonine protein kinase [Planctomycetota bacterium]|nr:serine/threonine protein kinase [Planctomycetota bacterium]
MPTLEDIRLGQLAVAQGLAQPLEIEQAINEQHRSEQSGNQTALGEILISHGYITRGQLERLLQMQRETAQKVTRIGCYDLIRKLGEGGMGAVYQAKDTRDNKIVALKVLPRSRARDKTFLTRFEAEARASFELDHPNIVRGYDLGHADGYHFLVMEYVEGHDVYSLLEQKGRFSEKEALSILRQTASALDHIHGERLVHRDIKPENIIVTPSGEAKLADMGLAVDKEAQGRRRITKAGIAMGTPFYLSPEQIQGKTEIDIRSDIYSLGATVYEMVTGRPPFEGDTAAVVMMKHLTEQVPSPHDIDRGISPGFCHVLERMMAKDPAERYQTPAELLEDLALAAQGKTPAGVRPGEGRSSVSRPLSAQVAEQRANRKSGSRVEPASRVNENLDKLAPLLERAARGPNSSSRMMGVAGRRSMGHSRVRSAIRPPVAGISMKWALLAGVAVAAIVTIVFLIVNIFGGSPK